MEIDFTKVYKKKDIVFLVRYFEVTGIQEIVKLTLRTIMKDWMVGTYKGSAFFIGTDMDKLLFPTSYEANSYLESIIKKPYIHKTDDIPSQLQDEDEEETDDIYSYIDGDEKESEEET